MSSESETIAINGVETYPSLSTLRDAHGTLLEQRRALGDDPNLLTAAERFIQHGVATGALLDGSEDRRAAQSLLNYWANMLYRAGRQSLDATLMEFDPLLAPTLPDSLCPYMGLDAFTESSADQFFGRQELITRLVDRLHEHRLVAVIGPSRSGKSSVVRGGLLPALRSRPLPGSEVWHYVPPLVPGSNPIESLARTLSSWTAAPKSADRLDLSRADNSNPHVDPIERMPTAISDTVASYTLSFRQDSYSGPRCQDTDLDQNQWIALLSCAENP